MINLKHYSNSWLFPRITLEPIAYWGTHISKNSVIQGNFSVLDYFKNLGLRLSFGSSARKSIKSLLDDNQVRHCDALTTSRSNYLSSCLRDNSNLKINLNDKTLEVSNCHLFVLDFGFYREQDFQTPPQEAVIDDAWSLNLELIQNLLTATVNHYVVSLPKVLGTPFGSLVICNNKCIVSHDPLDRSEKDFLLQNFNQFMSSYQILKEKRQENYNHLISKLEPYGFKEFFGLNGSAIFPGACVIKSEIQFNEKIFKRELQNFGVRGTSFFGNQAVILPCHQGLSTFDSEYIIEATKKSIEIAIHEKYNNFSS